ncbi:MAG TPA: ComF family protein [Xanthomonadales bacterium]|nr:ComF family protein [Xanthomonadales bacterium]
MRRWVDGLAWRLGHGVLPPCCVLCGGAGAGRDLCAGCAAALPRNRPCCARCGLPLPYVAAACGACAAHAPPWRALHAPFRYAWPLDRLVARYKFGGDLAAGAVLAAVLAEDLAGAADRVDAIVPVPLSRARLRTRGFNQALELARPLSRRFARPLHGDALRRSRDTAAQAGLDAAARRRNVRGAFDANPAVAGLRVALLDDVVTTGATAAACSVALLGAGARSVEVWALARAPPPAQPGASA